MPEEYYAINHSMSRRTPSTMDSAGILAEVVALNGAKGTITLGTGTWRIDMATTIPANARLVVEQGAMLTKSGSGTLTINGPFEAPLAQVFSGFSGTFNEWGIPTAASGLTFAASIPVDPRWFGAKADGTTDDFVAVQIAFQAVPVGGALAMPPGSSAYGYANGGNGLIVGKSCTIYGDKSTILLPAKNARIFTILDASNVRIHTLQIQGTVQTEFDLAGNLSQGAITVQGLSGGCSDIKIDNIEWRDTGSACMFGSVHRFEFANNRVMRTIAGIQSFSGTGIDYSDVNISDNFFLGDVTNGTSLGSDDQVAIFSGTAEHIRIERNTFDKQGQTSKNQAHAILITTNVVETVSDVRICDNVIRNVCADSSTRADPAIEIARSNADIAQIVISGNRIVNCNCAIDCSSISDVLIENNTIKDMVGVDGWDQGGCGILVTSVPSAVVRNNIIRNADVLGIAASASTDLHVSGNVVTDGGCTGIRVTSTSGPTIIDNTVKDCDGKGLEIAANSSCVLARNICTDNSGYGLQFWAAGGGGVCRDNTLSDNSAGDFSDTSTATSWAYSRNDGIQDSAIGLTLNWDFLTTGSTRTPDCSTANTFHIIAYNNDPLVVGNPINGKDGMIITIRIINSFGGEYTTLSWDTAYKLSTWTSPGASGNRSISFVNRDGTWWEISRTMFDVPN